MRGKAMSGAPIISGTNQLPKPPIIAGMTMKKTMIRPCAVISTFHMCSAVSRRPAPPAMHAGPGLEMLDARLGQLPAHQAGNAAADDPRDDREDQIEGADVLVVRRHEPAGEEARLVIGVMMRVMAVIGLEMDGVCGGVGHGLFAVLVGGAGALIGAWPAFDGRATTLRRRRAPRRSPSVGADGGGGGCGGGRPAAPRHDGRPARRPTGRSARGSPPRRRSACSRAGRRTARSRRRNRRPRGRPGTRSR